VIIVTWGNNLGTFFFALCILLRLTAHCWPSAEESCALNGAMHMILICVGFIPSSTGSQTANFANSPIILSAISDGFISHENAVF
jgi:hypothetical protein